MDHTQQIREKLDIVTFIGEFLTLKPAGRNFKAVCPFHTEKSPSFVVSPERQIWHCFGCNKGGDVFTFLMEYERVEFVEALRLLAKRTGVTLESSTFDSGTTSQKEHIYKVNAVALEFYHYILTKHKVGTKALTYITNRGVSEKVLTTFQLGFAPGVGNALSKYLVQKKKFSPDLLVAAGLSFKKGTDLVDFFRNRIMFPLVDHRDNVVGFAGRVLENTQTAKYINTRDTLVYHKRDSLYGFNVTKEAIKKANQVILLEGEFDVLSCFQHGVSNVVAVKGTALTENQVSLLARYAQKITMCFDGDRAGREAIRRSLPILEKKGVTTSVILIPDAKDPDEALKKNAGLFQKAVREDIGVYDYLLSEALQEFPPTTPDGKKRIADTLLPLFGGITNEIVKEHYLKKLSQAMDTTYESIQRELQRLLRPQVQPVKKVEEKQAKRAREEILEEYLLALVLQSSQPKAALDTAVKLLSELVGRERAYQKILVSLIEHVTKHETFDGKTFGTTLPQELSNTFDTCLLFPLPAFEDTTHEIVEIQKTASQLRELYLKEKIHTLADAIKKKEGAEDDEDVAHLRKQYSQFVAMLKS